MQLPIPDDWDGESWAMWAVCWPDSVEWRGILQGQLTELGYRSVWDESTGDADEATSTGLEIGEENVPLIGGLVRCDEQLDELIAAIGSLNSGSASGASCGCGGGTAQGTTNGQEGGTPPEKFDPPPNPPMTPEYDERKCKVANLAHAEILAWVKKMEELGVDAYIGGGFLSAGAFVLLTTIIAGALGEIITPFPLIDGLAGAVVGFVAGIATVITSQSFDLSALITIMEANEQDLVCALYEALDSDSAEDNYIQVLDDNGAATGAQLFVRAIMLVDYLNSLFFTPEDDPGLEAALSSYTAPFPCGSCLPCLNYWLSKGSVVVDNWPTSLDLASSTGPCQHSIIVYFRYDTVNFCGPGVVVTDISMTGQSNSSCTDFVLWDNVPSVIASSDVDVTVLYGQEGWIVELNSGGAFTATVTFTPQ